jgi:hypothetical protein
MQSDCPGKIGAGAATHQGNQHARAVDGGGEFSAGSARSLAGIRRGLRRFPHPPAVFPRVRERYTFRPNFSMR